MDLRTDRLAGDEFDSALADLIYLLSQLEEGFRARGSGERADRLRSDRDLIERGNAEGLTRLLGRFGDMGTIGDIGQAPDVEQVGALQAHMLATALRRSLE